jgi:hypothetical protein
MVATGEGARAEGMSQVQESLLESTPPIRHKAVTKMTAFYQRIHQYLSLYNIYTYNNTTSVEILLFISIMAAIADIL